MLVEIDQVEAFVAIVRRGGFTRAAAALHLSQPAVSRRLELLEREMGQPLFDRTRGGARLTEAGRTFLPHAEALLASMRDGLEAVQALNRADRGTVTLAMVGPLATLGLGDAEIIPIDSLTAQKRLVEAGFGLGLMPASSVEEELRVGTLRALRIAAMHMAVPVVLVHRRRAYLSGAARALMALLAARPSRARS